MEVGRNSLGSTAILYGLDGRGLNPGMDEIFHTRPVQHWGPPSILYNWYLVFPGGKADGVWRLSPTPSSAEVKERVELYIYGPSGPSCPVLG